MPVNRARLTQSRTYRRIRYCPFSCAFGKTRLQDSRTYGRLQSSYPPFVTCIVWKAILKRRLGEPTQFFDRLGDFLRRVALHKDVWLRWAFRADETLQIFIIWERPFNTKCPEFRGPWGEKFPALLNRFIYTSLHRLYRWA